MSQLPADEAIARFKENEERIDTFVNGTGTYNTNEETPREVESITAFMARKENDLNGRYLKFISRGAWATATDYDANDLVVKDNIVYIVLLDHTSGVFNTDFNSHKLAIHQEPIKALFSGATGDGVINDTASFTYLETLFTGRDIDLEGKTYKVDRQPTGNNYYGGNFKLSADNHIFKANRKHVSQAQTIAEATLKATSIDARYTIPPGLDGAIIVAGDSISHGAFAGNLYQNGWVNLLKRAINAQFGGKGYGFTPLLDLGTGPTLSKEVHEVTFSPGHSFTAAESTTGGEDVLQGLSYTSAVAGNYIEFDVPTFQSSVRIWYISDVGAGVFSYSVNGGAASNVDTNAARDNAKSVLINMVDNKKGSFKLRLAVVSGTVTLCGIGYEFPPAATSPRARNVVQNFSQSGRRLKPATEACIEKLCMGSMLILALGANDYGDCASDSAYNTAFQQRIDWVIKYCLKYNTTLVVVDCCWYADPSNPCRKGLKRASIETRGTYVGLPDYVTRDQTLTVEYSASYYLVSTLLKWSDVTHPNAEGQKWMFETVSKAIGLVCTSKEQVLALHDYAWPLQFDPASIFQNKFTFMPYLCHVKRNGGALLFSLKLETSAGGAIPAGFDYPVNKNIDAANSRQVQYLSSSGIDPYAPMTLTAAGAISTVYKTNLQNAIMLGSVTPYLNNLSFGFSVPYDFTMNLA